MLKWLILTVVCTGVLVGATGQTANSKSKPSTLRQVGYGQIKYAYHGPEYWHWQAVLARQRLKLNSRHILPWPFGAFLCIHSYEGSWTDPNAPYYGGLQMDRGFMNSYGSWALSRWGTADRWPVAVQMAVAVRAFFSGRGFYPWPNTAQSCGLID